MIIFPWIWILWGPLSIFVFDSNIQPPSKKSWANDVSCICMVSPLPPLLPRQAPFINWPASHERGRKMTQQWEQGLHPSRLHSETKDSWTMVTKQWNEMQTLYKYSTDSVFTTSSQFKNVKLVCTWCCQSFLNSDLQYPTPRIPYSCSCCCCCSCSSVTKSVKWRYLGNQAWYHRSAGVKTTGKNSE